MSDKDPWTSKAEPLSEEAGVVADKAITNKDKTGAPEQWMQAWAKEVLLEQRRARRGRMIGGVLRGLITLVIVLVVFGSGRELMSLSKDEAPGAPHLAVVDVRGALDSEGRASAERVLQGARRAFNADGARAVVLRINSPGGSPVQAGQIYEGIRELRERHPQLPVYAVIEELGASGGYYVAVAADTIVADRSSLVGSIGVVSGGFGFKEAIERLGIERRVFTAGDNKAFMDPFSDMDAQQRAFWQQVLDSTHQQFIARVKEGRGERLANNPQIFSGLVWNGELALEQGLVDELGSLFTLQARLGVERSINYTPEPSPWERLERRLGTAIKAAAMELAAPRF
ncbi:S49 family peptidase [Marinospirillum alkaliphilum]|uniref:Protease-4 n=1 Tax=Marinospirillum alkaliphilum DSM 21637 TaxID=1122209 RepID=A0A1K1X726_9GAMM|nr:S49 family peptidase [Marinospirillum alkaliphilum]SFX45424.1 protease-4 [Marinospirillum alkaliphilum DSM 21637]